MTADEFTDEWPAQKEEIGLTVHLDNENFPQVEIKLYRYDGSRCLVVVDGESVSLMDRTAVVNLIEAVHAIVLNYGRQIRGSAARTAALPPKGIYSSCEDGRRTGCSTFE